MAVRHNWTGDQRCMPARIEKPADRADLIEAVRRAGDQGLTVRAVGSGHSYEISSPSRADLSSSPRELAGWGRAK